MGKKLDQVIDLAKNYAPDTIKLHIHCGIVQTFVLNQVLTSPGFLQNIDELQMVLNKKKQAVTGKFVYDTLKDLKNGC